MSGQRSLGLALGGGGGKGSAHIGVLRVLEQLEVPIDAVAGTSIGGIVGALVAAGYRSDEIEVAFRSAKLHRILELDFANFGVLGTTKMAAMLREMLGDRQIGDLAIPYAAVTVDLVSGKEVHLTAGPVVEAALASAAVPGIFPPVRINDAILIDGGLFNNVPVDVARHLGEYHLHGVAGAPLPGVGGAPQDDARQQPQVVQRELDEHTQ